MQNFWLSIILYNLTLSLVKLTFLLQYYRVLSVHKMKKVIWTLGILIMLWALSQLFVVVFTCVPVQKFWYTDLPGHCMPNLPFWYINAAGNIATDLAIFIMPLPVLKSLQLRKKQKYFLMGIFSLGFLYVEPTLGPLPRLSLLGSALCHLFPAALSLMLTLLTCMQHICHLSHPPRVPQARSRLHLRQRPHGMLVLHRAVRWHYMRVPPDAPAADAQDQAVVDDKLRDPTSSTGRICESRALRARYTRQHNRGQIYGAPPVPPRPRQHTHALYDE